MISFGAKIPITKCKIQNRETGKTENATVYEYTCTDKSDVDKIDRIVSKEDWEFGTDIADDAWWKNHTIENKDSRYGYVNDYHIYSIENNRRKTIGICETKETDYVNVELFETLQNKKYKFVGQSFLASLAQKASNSAKCLIIENAAIKALGFYRDACGFTKEFEEDDEISFVVDASQLQQFIQQTEQRTEGKIVCLNV